MESHFELQHGVRWYNRGLIVSDYEFVGGIGRDPAIVLFEAICILESLVNCWVFRSGRPTIAKSCRVLTKTLGVYLRIAD